MKVGKLSDFTGGWVAGDFEPSLLRTKDVEFAVKNYKAGDKEAAHYHALAVEVTVIAAGSVEMNGVRYEKDDVIVIERNDTTDFHALTDAVTAVIKIPSVLGDKYVVEG